MDDVFVVLVHFFHTVADDSGQFVGKGRIPCPNCWIGMSHQQRVPVLMLQAFPVEGRSS